MARAHISDDHAKAEAGGGTKRIEETTIEITYRCQLLPWLALQPDYQIVKNPSADPGKETASIYSLRFEMVF